MGPLYLVFFAIGLGFLVILLLKKNPAAEEAGWHQGERVEPGPRVEGLATFEMDRDTQAELLDAIGLVDLELTDDDPEMVAWRGRVPDPVTGGVCVIHCLRGEDPATRDDIFELKRGMKTKGDAIKGILVSPAGFTVDSREEAEGRPMELIDGQRLRGLLSENLPGGLDRPASD